MTGRIVTDGSVSCTTLNYDLVKNTWWTDVQDAIGIRTEQLPEIVQPGTNVGALSPEAAGQLGLSTKTSVVTGGMDQAVGAIGAGNFKPGKVSESTGAALAIQATITDPMIDRSKSGTRLLPQRTRAVSVCPGLSHSGHGLQMAP